MYIPYHCLVKPTKLTNLIPKTRQTTRVHGCQKRQHGCSKWRCVPGLTLTLTISTSLAGDVRKGNVRILALSLYEDAVCIDSGTEDVQLPQQRGCCRSSAEARQIERHAWWMVKLSPSQGRTVGAATETDAWRLLGHPIRKLSDGASRRDIGRRSLTQHRRRRVHRGRGRPDPRLSRSRSVRLVAARINRCKRCSRATSELRGRVQDDGQTGGGDLKCTYVIQNSMDTGGNVIVMWHRRQCILLWKITPPLPRVVCHSYGTYSVCW